MPVHPKNQSDYIWWFSEFESSHPVSKIPLMYDWRNMNAVERLHCLRHRNGKRYPAHELPHFSDGLSGTFFITASNFLHSAIIGKSEERIARFTENLMLEILRADFDVSAYCVLPNHYHFLAKGSDPRQLRAFLGKLHGRTSRQWNLEDQQIGRKVWYRVFDKYVTSNRQYYTTLNYIHNNPIKAGLCSNIMDWPWSSANEFIKTIGIENAVQIWKTYPP